MKRWLGYVLLIATFFGAVHFFVPMRADSKLPLYTSIKKVVDGDTLIIANGARVRLLGVDTPEEHVSKKLYRDAARKNVEPHVIQAQGKASHAFTERLAQGKGAVLLFDPHNESNGHYDHYGRLLAYVFLVDESKGDLDASYIIQTLTHGKYAGRQALFLNASIIRAGYGRYYRSFSYSHKDDFRQYEQSAREEKRGLWQAPKHVW